ncbi:MAG: hypothetical protein ACLP2Y_03435 [Limisphaerales bacterium]
MKLANITMKLTLAAGLFLGPIITASADPVVFNVNMSVQTDLGNFNPGNGDTVLVAGNWDGWLTTHTMAVSANTNIYTLTLNLTVGSYPDYKFIINPGGDSSGNALNWEVPSSFGGGDRYFGYVTAGGTNLPAVYFSDDSNAPTQCWITFQVDMGPAITQGKFTIGSSYVDVFGSWNNWSSSGGFLLANVPGTSNYVGTLDTSALSLGSLVDYKYAIDGYGGTWEGNVGTNGTANRTFALTSTNEVLPLNLWNNITNANVSYAVTFQVNLLVEYLMGLFTPGSDYVYVNGDWDWTGTEDQLTQTANPYVYTGTVAIAFSPGTLVNYKYDLNGGLTWENDGVGPGGFQNRQFTLMGNTNLPLDYFNNFADLGPVNISVSGTNTALSWASGTNAPNHIRLQNSSSLLGVWVDVPNTQGQSAVTNNFGPGAQFFRLIGP